MKEEIGVIVEIKGNMARVKVSRHSDCENCGSCPGDSAMVIDAQNLIGAEPGQRVAFETKEENMLRAAFIVYMMPLIAVLIGSYLGYIISLKTGISAIVLEVIGGTIAVVISIIAIKKFDNASRDNTKIQPIITRIL